MWKPSPEELLRARVITQISDGAQFAMTQLGLEGSVADLEKGLLAIPAYQSIKRHAPETFEQIMLDMRKGFKGDASEEEVVTLIREQTTKIYSRYLPISENDALLNATRRIVEVMTALEKANPEACYAFLFPGGSHVDFMGLLSDDLKNALLESMAEVIETGVSNPQAIPGEDQVAKTLDLVRGALARRYGDDIALLSDASAPGVDKKKVCSMSVAFSQQILRLPKKESVPLLRFVYAD